MKKTIKTRELTRKGLLITFTDGTHCLVNAEQIATCNALGVKIGLAGNEVDVVESVDMAGNIDPNWVRLAI